MCSRLNFSHGTHDDHAARFAMIRQLETRFDRPIGILADVQGPSCTLGTSPADACSCRPVSNSSSISTPRQAVLRGSTCRTQEIIEAASIGCSLLLDDGKLRLRVARKRSDALETEVVVGGPLSDHKGVNVPDIVLPIPALTDKDRNDMAFALEHGANFIGLSFVQRPEDVAEAKELIRGRAWVMVKLEKPQALDNLERHHAAHRRSDGGPRRSSRGGTAAPRRCRWRRSASSDWRVNWASPSWWPRRCWRA